MRKSYRQSSVIRDFGQWVVTTYGVECSTAYYPISKRRLGTGKEDHSWEAHMAEKEWVNLHSFGLAIAFARRHFQKRVAR